MASKIIPTAPEAKNLDSLTPLQRGGVKPLANKPVREVKVTRGTPSVAPGAQPISKTNVGDLQKVIGTSKHVLARGIYGAHPTEIKLNRVGNVPFAGAKISQGFGNLGEHFNTPLSESDRLILGVAFQSVVANKLHQKIS